jgi:hypothetical protein
MSIAADALFVEQYNSMVTHAFQPQGFIMQGMFQPQTKIVGRKAYFPTFGRATARLKNRGVKAELDNPAADQRQTDLLTWEHLAAVYDFDGTRMAANEMTELTKAAGMGMGRVVDLAGIAILAANAPTSGTGYVDGNANATPAGQLTAGLLQIGLGAWIDQNNIPVDGQLYGGISMSAHQQLMADSSYANSQWVGPDLPFKSNGITQGRTWNFVNWVILPAEYLPVNAANTQDCFVWHKGSIGWTTNKKLTSEWQRDIDLGAWKVRHESEGCGLALRSNAVMRIRVKTNLTGLTKV